MAISVQEPAATAPPIGQGRLAADRPQPRTVEAPSGFRLRGYHLNPFVDAANPLLGMVIRARDLTTLDNVAGLYQQVVEEIQAIQQELTGQGYDQSTLLAFRYVLCAFVDEAVMGTEWGRQSNWPRYSLLSRFHDETWGGEKVFSILARLQQEPKRYESLLTFIYLCLCLGFKGRYRIQPGGQDEYQRIVRALGDQLSSLQGVDNEGLTEPERHITRSGSHSGTGIPLWLIYGLFGLVAVGLYLAMSWSLDQQAAEVTGLLSQIIEQTGK